ncbi:uncharacterized protein [Bemisia tabaci]|uniref:uncharacterized protein isoform X2 n=1 Tax=Bemisia tabaci TaxID=7038 RepID=UPI003B27FF07
MAASTAADHFCLRWNNYQINMVSELDSLRKDEDLVDVTLSCEGQLLKAHKVILSACSSYFRNVFKENPCKHPVVILKDVSHEDVEALLSFVYQGVVYISEKKLASFLHTAELLQIRGLTGAASTMKADMSQYSTDKSTTLASGPPPLAPANVGNNWKPVAKKSSGSNPSSPAPSAPKRRKAPPSRIPPSEDADNTSNQEIEESSEEEHQSLQHQALQQQHPSQQHHQYHPQLPLSSNQEAAPVIVKSEDGFAHDEEEYEDGTRGSFHGGEGESSSGETTGYYQSLASVDMGDEGDEEEDEEGDGRDDKGGVTAASVATLLERSLVAVSRSGTDVQGSSSNSSVGALSIFPGSVAHGGVDHANPTDRLGRRPCPLCQKIISNKSNLLKHMRIRHSDEYNPAGCVLCGKVFKNKYSLRAHINIYHKEVTSSMPSPLSSNSKIDQYSFNPNLINPQNFQLSQQQQPQNVNQLPTTTPNFPPQNSNMINSNPTMPPNNFQLPASSGFNPVVQQQQQQQQQQQNTSMPNFALSSPVSTVSTAAIISSNNFNLPLSGPPPAPNSPHTIAAYPTFQHPAAAQFIVPTTN